jgi:hypothetical protein
MNRIVFIIAFICILNGCTVYTEKQSEALSRNVYATKDSIDFARVDLASQYANETIRLVKPPKTRIDIQPVYIKNSPETIDKRRVAFVPQEYKNDKIVIVNTSEYDELLKNKAVSEQLKQDNVNILTQKKFVDEELQKQIEYREQMVRDLNIMQRKLAEKDLAILQRNVIILVLSLLIGIGVYLRFKGGLVF